jgi:chemotaxis protein MotB
MNAKTALWLPFVVLFTFSGCGKKEIKRLEGQLEASKEQVEQLKGQVDHLQKSNASLLDRMADLSIVSKTEAQTIKKSLDNISDQYGFIQDLTTKMQQKDSLNLQLVMNLKRSLSDINDQGIQVEVRGGKVHVSISDRLLFASGSARINTAAQGVLGKIATVLNDHSDLQVMVEGHTDDVPVNTRLNQDNWDLSVRRATAVVRSLQQDYFVDPGRLTAAGRAQYDPRADNATSTGRQQNRRTEIVITPRLDQFFELLEAPAVAG